MADDDDPVRAGAGHDRGQVRGDGSHVVVHGGVARARGARAGQAREVDGVAGAFEDGLKRLEDGGAFVDAWDDEDCRRHLVYILNYLR